MSNEKHETLADIVREMRIDCRARHMDGTMYREEDWVYTKGTAKKLADRIEAAWKAERERAKADALVVGGMVEAMRREKRGNAAKIREAYEFAEEFLRDYGTDWKLHNKLCDMLKSALAEPLRNCDVYTVGEALRKYGFPTKIKPWGEKEWLDSCEWLVSEVEGETKGE